MNVLNTVTKYGEKILEAIGAFMLAVMLVLIFGDVISRYFLSKSYDFVPLWAAWLMVWITYLIAGLNIKYNRDMSVDFIFSKLSEKYKTRLSILFDVITLFFGVLLCVAAIQYVEILHRVGRISPISIPIPMWIVESGVAVCGAFLAFFSLDRIILAVYEMRKPKVEAKMETKEGAN